MPLRKLTLKEKLEYIEEISGELGFLGGVMGIGPISVGIFGHVNLYNEAISKGTDTITALQASSLFLPIDAIGVYCIYGCCLCLNETYNRYKNHGYGEQIELKFPK